MRNLLFLTVMAAFGLAFGVAADAQTKKIGMAKAKAIALKQAAGKIESSELERENGKMIYSFDIRNAKGTITEVQIEAFTGEVVSVEEEDAQAEADEKRQEKNGKMNKDDDDEESDASRKANQEKYAREAKITMEQAKEIALKRVAGTITDQELEKKKAESYTRSMSKTQTEKVLMSKLTRKPARFCGSLKIRKTKATTIISRFQWQVFG